MKMHWVDCRPFNLVFQCSNLELLIFAFALRVTQWYSVCKAKSFFMMKQEKKINKQWVLFKGQCSI